MDSKIITKIITTPPRKSMSIITLEPDLNLKLEMQNMIRHSQPLFNSDNHNGFLVNASSNVYNANFVIWRFELRGRIIGTEYVNNILYKGGAVRVRLEKYGVVKMLCNDKFSDALENNDRGAKALEYIGKMAQKDKPALITLNSKVKEKYTMANLTKHVEMGRYFMDIFMTTPHKKSLEKGCESGGDI
ncbi:hypothetical protein CHS0354_038912 [Potamilus streckersoni]|uniref:Uncharacterized protein n=1 Tax=Potamilus streckersoni TaxID=2493646 RepID=A0AAE0SRH3_9BIVA|nr:hypothetical protein CHS0354_038912 [Potamilus streckersoni]